MSTGILPSNAKRRLAAAFPLSLMTDPHRLRAMISTWKHSIWSFSRMSW